MKIAAKLLAAAFFAFAATPHVTAQASEPVDLRGHCALEWPGDYDMQLYCYDKEIAAAFPLKRVYEAAMWNSQMENILALCLRDWGRFEFQMQLYCYNKQASAYNRLHPKTPLEIY